jgi:hypothetical protein
LQPETVVNPKSDLKKVPSFPATLNPSVPPVGSQTIRTFIILEAVPSSLFAVPGVSLARRGYRWHRQRALIPFEEILEEASEHFETDLRRLNNAAHATRRPVADEQRLRTLEL